MLSYGLKPHDRDDREQALEISRTLKGRGISNSNHMIFPFGIQIYFDLEARMDDEQSALTLTLTLTLL